jgi:hypothetical protein
MKRGRRQNAAPVAAEGAAVDTEAGVVPAAEGAGDAVAVVVGAGVAADVVEIAAIVVTAAIAGN